jgi:radical SAM enzyme (rSAM/lipoprotein system)
MAQGISFKKKIALELFRQFKRNSAKIHELNYIFWECTLKCNLSCLHCGSDCKKESEVKDMPVADFLKAIDSITPIVNPNKTIIVFTGGEPLVREDLEVCGNELYNRGFPWGIVTNGFLLTPERLRSLMNSGMRSITISLDGFENSHNWLRGNNYSFRNALEAIKLLPSTVNLKYDVVTCATQKNIDELKMLKETLIQIGISDWRIFTIFPIGRAKEYPELQLSSVQFKLLLDFIKDTRKEGRIHLSYGCEGFLGEYEGEVRDNFFFCQAGISVASILADGSISACPNLRDNFIQGNIYKNDFAEVWNNGYNEFRNREWARKGECKECSSFRYCEGNGMHLHDEKNGDLLFCHLKKLEDDILIGF